MLFSLFDTKACNFGPLISLENADVARRHFLVALLSDTKSPVRDFPDDYILYELGDFDNTTGKFLINPSPVQVMTGFEAVEAAKEYIRKKEKERLDYESRFEIDNDSESPECVGQSN